MDRWKKIAGFDGYYVSREGRVGSVRRLIHRSNGSTLTIGGKLLRAGRSKNGYLVVMLGRGKPRYVHHLVAEAFIGPKLDGLTVSHLDGCKTNNNASNLVYESLADNIRRNSSKEAPRGSRNGHSKLTEHDVLAIRRLKNSGYGFFTTLAREYGMSPSTIREAYIGRSWKCLRQKQESFR